MKIIRPIAVTDTGSFTRATTGTYYNKSGTLLTAAIDTPRFGYDPSTLIPIGLLEESAATNLVLQSEQFENAAWTKTNISVAANFTTAPDGNTTADLLTTLSVGGTVTQAVSVSSGTTYTFSTYVKAYTSSEVRINIGSVQADYDLDEETGTITSGSGTASLHAVGEDDWYRIVLVFTAASSSVTITITNNSGSTDAFSIWGVQLESGSSYTSYISTTSSTVTRAADVNDADMLSSVTEADAAVWSASTVYIEDDQVMLASGGTHKVYQSATGDSSTVTFDTGNDLVLWTAHGKVADTPIVFSTTGTLPTGIVVGTVYYISATTLTADSFKVAATVGGAPINLTGSGSGTHTARASTNYNKNPEDNPTVWVELEATNRWKMFDSSVQSQTEADDAIFVAIKASSRFNSLGLLNINAQGIRIILNDPVEGVVYDETLNGISANGIINWYAYFTEPIQRRTDFAITDIPLYANATLNIILYNTGNEVLCGGAIIGLYKDIGDTQFGAKVGIQDYSVKTRDSFGNYTIVTRAFNKKASFTVVMDSREVDAIQNLLATYRATPIIYIGEDTYGATIVYGFYKNFDIDIGYFDGDSICTLEVEGLT